MLPTYTTYYYFKVAISSLLTVLERLQVSGRPATVLHYYTVLIKELQCIPVIRRGGEAIQWQHKQYIAWTKELHHSVVIDHLRDVAEKNPPKGWKVP
jgi:hypothetical protein